MEARPPSWRDLRKTFWVWLKAMNGERIPRCPCAGLADEGSWALLLKVFEIHFCDLRGSGRQDPHIGEVAGILCGQDETQAYRSAPPEQLTAWVVHTPLHSKATKATRLYHRARLFLVLQGFARPQRLAALHNRLPSD